MTPGDRVGSLVVLGAVDSANPLASRLPEFACLCDCGRYSVQRLSALTSGRAVSCRTCRYDTKWARIDDRAKSRDERRPYDGELTKIRVVTAQRAKAGLIPKRVHCEICEDSYRVKAHHESYFAPDDVIWLCDACHGRRHARLSDRGRDPGVQYARGRNGGAAMPVTYAPWLPERISPAMRRERDSTEAAE